MPIFLGSAHSQNYAVSLLYADDLTLWAENPPRYQAMLDRVHAWGVRWRVIFNMGPAKTAGMWVCKPANAPDVTFHLGDQQLPMVDSYKYLGALFDKLVKWDAHASKLKSALFGKYRALALRSISMGYPRGLAVMIWKVAVRSAVEHGQEAIFLPVSAVSWIERLQNNFCRFAVGAGFGGSATVLRFVLERWQVAKIKFFHRLANLQPARILSRVYQ